MTQDAPPEPTDPTCPITGVPMLRSMRPMTLTYKGETITFNMPGWYCSASDESIHIGADMKLSDRMLNRLKARAEGLLVPRHSDFDWLSFARI
jgi:HTH-type transcriptional regulator/antitoxin MqsA